MGSTSYVGNAATFLIETLFGLYILVMMLRFLLQWARADFYNPVSQFIVKATQPVLRPMRRLIPGFGGVDVAAIVALFVLKYVELWLLAGVLGQTCTVSSLVVLSIAKLLTLTVYVFFVAIIILVVISWVNPGLYNPVTSLLGSLTDPLMRPARRYIPPISGLDLSPLAVLIILQLVLMLVIHPIRDLSACLPGL